MHGQGRKMWSQFVHHDNNLHKQSKSNVSGMGDTQGVSAGELSCTCTGTISPGLWTSALHPELQLQPSCRGLQHPRQMAHIFFFLHWDEVPGQKEKVCAGDTDVWQLCSESSSHLLSRQRSAWRCCPEFLPCFPLKLLALRGARLMLAPSVLLALLLQVAST